MLQWCDARHVIDALDLWWLRVNVYECEMNSLLISNNVGVMPCTYVRW